MVILVPRGESKEDLAKNTHAQGVLDRGWGPLGALAVAPDRGPAGLLAIPITKRKVGILFFLISGSASAGQALPMQSALACFGRRFAIVAPWAVAPQLPHLWESECTARDPRVSGSPSRGQSPTAGARGTRHKRRTKRTCLYVTANRWFSRTVRRTRLSVLYTPPSGPRSSVKFPLASQAEHCEHCDTQAMDFDNNNLNRKVFGLVPACLQHAHTC